MPLHRKVVSLRHQSFTEPSVLPLKASGLMTMNTIINHTYNISIYIKTYNIYIYGIYYKYVDIGRYMSYRSPVTTTGNVMWFKWCEKMSQKETPDATNSGFFIHPKQWVLPQHGHRHMKGSPNLCQQEHWKIWGYQCINGYQWISRIYDISVKMEKTVIKWWLYWEIFQVQHFLRKPSWPSTCMFSQSTSRQQASKYNGPPVKNRQMMANEHRVQCGTVKKKHE